MSKRHKHRKIIASHLAFSFAKKIAGILALSLLNEQWRFGDHVSLNTRWQFGVLLLLSAYEPKKCTH
jgi:hypothetical protein